MPVFPVSPIPTIWMSGKFSARRLSKNVLVNLTPQVGVEKRSDPPLCRFWNPPADHVIDHLTCPKLSSLLVDETCCLRHSSGFLILDIPFRTNSNAAGPTHHARRLKCAAMYVDLRLKLDASATQITLQCEHSKRV